MWMLYSLGFYSYIYLLPNLNQRFSLSYHFYLLVILKKYHIWVAKKIDRGYKLAKTSIYNLSSFCFFIILKMRVT